MFPVNPKVTFHKDELFVFLTPSMIIMV